jgi:hypothetical protein
MEDYTGLRNSVYRRGMIGRCGPLQHPSCRCWYFRGENGPIISELAEVGQRGARSVRGSCTIFRSGVSRRPGLLGVAPACAARGVEWARGCALACHVLEWTF